MTEEVPQTELGYSFLPRGSGATLDHYRLDVNLRPEPTMRHYDPESLRLRVATQETGMEHLQVTHPWSSWPYYRACVGQVLIQDRKGEQVGAFTYGGELHIESSKVVTRCVLTSPAPILREDGGDSLAPLLIQESEVLLAELAARSSHKPFQFESRLSHIEPRTLYRACLTFIEGKLSSHDSDEPAPWRELHALVRSELERLDSEGAPPLPLPKLEDLLQREDLSSPS